MTLYDKDFDCVLFYVTACPGPPEAPTLDSNIPPNVDLSWSPPSASGAWSYTYEVSWTNGSVIVPRQAGTTGQTPGLQAETQYTVEITAYPESTLCPEQATTFMFMTTQSKWKVLYMFEVYCSVSIPSSYLLSQGRVNVLIHFTDCTK